MNKTRAISIFLKRSNLECVEMIRSKYDDLFHKIPPHITLVFPFRSDLTLEACIEHMHSCLQGYESFSIRLEGLKVADDGCLFLLVRDGKEQIEQLNRSLYSGPLRTYKSEEHTFIPHVTIGRFNHIEQAKAVQKKVAQLIPNLSLLVDRITLESIGVHGYSELEYVYQLN
ncbi:2'-5' RNA ligase family protein [Pseudalkalibacillus berkeleyi]|uniref:2'-5' RNA ligase family protein n=1 Tax=Pseudalkalibacillus berkeleyi TaxID=1069813 RepID=A0ABS9GX23_9BACL|nr:2'-5' RNA ligase family protein [Pseudalkalibacillus berkeleyi]MCF6137329.1 2'-5' RNA ligase family protein [Pseudalkalibacillus berkeleyi]